MCGFSIILNSKKNKSEQLDLIKKMNKSIQNRGPDHSDIYDDDNIILGHQRLSIIDLTSFSDQPMQIGDYIIVYNGEIYNFKEIKLELEHKYNVKFKSSGDTEVLLNAYKYWGENCLSKLNGIFAFAIWNKDKQELFCARDRFGVKPFYYTYNSSNELICCSEIKGIFAYGENKAPNYKTLQNYLLQGVYGFEKNTFFNNVNQLQAGSFMLLKKGTDITIKKYYNLENNVLNSNQYISEEDAFNDYSKLLNDSVRSQLVSDVNIGVTLSSGLDSSILYSQAKKNIKLKDLTAYTYTFNDKNYDESRYVKESIKNEKWKLIECNEELFLSDIEKLIVNQYEPIGGLSLLGISEIFKKGRNEDETIVYLCGEGLDEQWCGYDYYNKVSAENLQNISAVQGTTSSINTNILDKSFIESYDKIFYPEPFKDSINNLKFRDLFYTKIPRNLSFLDRTSMLHSVEARVPFLNHELVEASFKLPKNYMIRNEQNKYLLREWYKNEIPNYASKKNKQFIQSPQREWLKNNEMIQDMINSTKFNERSIFNSKKIKSNFEKYKKGNFDNSFFIWQWLNLEFWFQNIIDQ